MKTLKRLLLAVILFSFPAIGEGSINSDVRIEIVSQIKKYKKDLQKLVKKVDESQDPEERELIIQQINLLKKRLKI